MCHEAVKPFLNGGLYDDTVLYHDLIAERKILRGEMPRRCELLPVQVIQQLPPHPVLGRILLLHCAVGSCRYVTHRPRCPTVHDVDCGELPLVKIQIEHAGNFSGVLHAETHQVLILLRRDRLRLQIQRDKFAGAVACILEVFAERPCGIQQLLAGRHAEVMFLAALYNAVCGIGTCRLRFLPCHTIFLPDLSADTCIFTLWKLVAQFIQHILQMLL